MNMELYPAFHLGLFLVLLKGIGALLGTDSESCDFAISNSLRCDVKRVFC